MARTFWPPLRLRLIPSAILMSAGRREAYSRARPMMSCSGRPVTAAMAPQSLLADPGGNQPHENRQPFLCITFIISLFGIFPTPS